MALSKQSSYYLEDKRFLSDSYLSEEKFTKEFKKYYYGKPRSKELYLLVLTELENALVAGNIGDFKRLAKMIGYFNGVESRETLSAYYDDIENPIKATNLVILACKHNKVDILKYVFGNAEIYENLSIYVGKNAIAPDNKDELYHNAFYYAILSGNVELLDTLIKKWPCDYFACHSEELDEVLSGAYEELKWKNVSLSESMEIFVQKELINLRFFSDNSGKVFVSVEDRIKNIKERVALVLEKITYLKSDYSNVQNVDEKFLFVARFIALNIHVLKRQLKFTYDLLPWEEVEFCLVSFISSYLIHQDINLFYRTILNKSKILSYLDNFANKLICEMHIIVESVDISRLSVLPKLNRDCIVEQIIHNNPEFKQLYDDYQQIRDIHSLEKISEYLNLALSSDPKERQGQLIITRALQVIGEYLKNTLESPKLSNTISDLLLISLPKNTRKVVIDLRNSLSHAHSLARRSEISQNNDAEFFVGIQNDTKKIDNVITDILYKKKMIMIRTLLLKIANTESLDEIQQVGDILKNVEVDKMMSNGFKVMEYENLEKLIQEMSDAITDQTDRETEFFRKINRWIRSIKNESENIKADYCLRFSLLKGFINGFYLHYDSIETVKGLAVNTLVTMFSQKEEKRRSFKEITELSMKIYQSAWPKLQGDNLDILNRSISKILHIAEFENNDIKWIEKLKAKLYEKGSFIPTYKQNKTYCSMNGDEYNKQLALKLSELKTILNNDQMGNSLIENPPLYRKNKKLQAAVEMLVLDIMSILGTSENHLENDLFFLDGNTPLLTGKCLRNHLAHGNLLLDILLSDPSTAVILNAVKLTSENIVNNQKKVGRLVQDDPSKLKDKFDQCLITIMNQQEMFAALEEGNLEKLKTCLAKGADIKARSINLWSALHFAACGPSLEVVKYILDNANITDINGRSPLHISAIHGRTGIVDFLVSKALIPVDILDNDKRTPLQLAAENGHKDTVEILLKFNANTNNSANPSSYAPLHYAIECNHVDVALVLLEKEVNVDANETTGGCTPLRIAAEAGCLDVVQVLLSRGANVNTRDDKGATPLHPAAIKGYLEVVEALILNGANVNARTLDGCTPLLYAVQYNRQEIAEVLLKHGADVNISDKNDGLMPLHYAVQNGREDIAEILIKHRANVHLTDFECKTVLHYAAKKGHSNVAVALIKHGINIHAVDAYGKTALHVAAECGQFEVAQILIRYGAEVNNRGQCNHGTPLLYAALYGHKDVAELLINNRAVINVTDEKGFTPLHAAAQMGHLNVVDLLLRNKAKVDTILINGQSPLHVACLNGHKEVAAFLIQHKALVTRKCYGGLTPLHAAVSGRHKDIVELLINNGAELNVKGRPVPNARVLFTPLEVAVQLDDAEIVEMLAANGANVNIRNSDTTPLLSAVEKNHEEMVRVLLENGANVNAESGMALINAVQSSSSDMVNLLLQNNARLDSMDPNGVSLLLIAAKRGNKDIVNALIAKGAKINALVHDGPISRSPLFIAAAEGHEEVVEVLIGNNACIDFSCSHGTALHAAAACGHVNIVNILLDKGATINLKNDEKRTPLEIAAQHGHLSIVRILLKLENVDLNSRNDEGQTLLHFASEQNNLELIMYLVDKGYDIHARDNFGAKPIHIAARCGCKDIVEFFLSKGLNVDETDASSNPLLHYAVVNNHLEVVKYLIAKGANVHVKDAAGSTLIHHAAMLGFKAIVVTLLENGVVYNSTNNKSISPLEMSVQGCSPDLRIKYKSLCAANKGEAANLLRWTEELFAAVQLEIENASQVQKCIEAGAFVNAKNAGNKATPLHYAARKGHHKIVDILLENKANPNIVCKGRFTPLHYAAKFSHLECVKSLLHYGAIYNVTSKSRKMASDLAANQNIAGLFNLIDDLFRKVENNDYQVILDLNKINDSGTLKAVMNACNTGNKTLTAIASRSNLLLFEKLKLVYQGDVSTQIEEAKDLLIHGNYQEAISIYKRLLEKRKQLLGPNNLATLDIKKDIGIALYKQGNYQAALDVLEEVFCKQHEILGLDGRETLNTRSTIALVMFRQDKFDEASKIFLEVYEKQKDLLGPCHKDTIDTRFHYAGLLKSQGKLEEALNIYRTMYQVMESILGPRNMTTVSALNNIGVVLSDQGKYEEALKILEDVMERKKSILGINHTDTLRTLFNIGDVFLDQHKYPEALKTFKNVLDIQKKTLQRNHPDILNTQFQLATVLCNQGKFIAALKLYKECYDQRVAVFGPNHPSVEIIHKTIEIMNLKFKIEGRLESDIFQYLQIDMNVIAGAGDVETIKFQLDNGADPNDSDIDGKTPLHYAISNEHIEVVDILLKNGADVTCATNKGNTPLHTATFKSNCQIVEMLLQHVNREDLNAFLDAKIVSEGTTSLHIAAKNGCLDVVKSLLKHGATYDIKNKRGKTPANLSKNKDITSLLELIDEVFKGVKNGCVEVTNKLKALKPDEFSAVVNARNIQGHGLLQVALVNEQRNIADVLSELL